MKNKHILIVTMHFYPTIFRVNDVAEELIKRGYKVTVVTGIPNFPQAKFAKGYGIFRKRRETYNGIDIVRLPIFPRGNRSISLILNYLSFQFSGFFFSIFTRIKADHVLIYGTSPMIKARIGLRYAKRRKINSTFYVMDLWPDNVQYAGNIHHKGILNYLTQSMTKIYQDTTRILTSSMSFIDKIAEMNISKDKIEFWPQYAEDLFSGKEVEINLDDDTSNEVVNFIFAGSIGVAQGLDMLIDSAVILKNQDILVKFNIVGEGRERQNLMKQSEDLAVSHYFQFYGKRPLEEMPSYFKQNDAALLTLQESPIFDLTIPAKLQSYMAYGLPIMASANGEVQSIVKLSNCGYCAKAGDVNEFTKNIIEFTKLTIKQRKELGSNAKTYSNKHFNKSKLMDRLEEIINT
ncbi:MAG: glycosyltransferase family 4 protein [Acholeplasmataceae bacterium]|nr:glycosyltransferase family 4 protein [Acholeplasmataceae bacterium]